MNDYYKILDLEYKYSAFQLFGNYLEKTKEALASNNEEEFAKVRMGFEVLRNETVIDDYNRIYRKYILNEELNFPKAREERMIECFKVKERIGAQIASEVIERHESYLVHYLKFIFSFIFVDLINFMIGACGIFYILIGMCMIVLADSPLNFIGIIFLILGYYFLRRNIVGVIMV